MPEPGARSARRGARTLAAVVRQDLAAARAAARGELAAAEAELAAAEQQLARLRAEQPGTTEHVAAAHQAARAELGARYSRQAATLVRQIDALATVGALGAAGTSWRMWRPTPVARGQAPGFFRIGRTTVEGRALPALVPLLDEAHLALSGPLPDTLDGLVGGLLLRVLGSTSPGAVRLAVYDPGRLGGSLAGLAPLASGGLLTSIGPGGLDHLLDDLVEQVRRIHETVLAGEYASLAEFAGATGRRPEPWRVAVLLFEPDAALSPAAAAQLDRILRTGVACGVHVLARGLPPGVQDAAAPVERVEVSASGYAVTSLTGTLPITLDTPPPAELVTAACKALAEEVLAGPPPAAFEDLLPRQPWAESSADGLIAPLGEGPDGRLVEVMLGDDPPHALIGGPSGSGKTNLIYGWLAALCARYDPDELELYLLDFKEGVSFARFAPGRRDPSWLPHVRLVGVNVNSDREFGLALLRHLEAELRRRAAAAKRYEATKLAELRQEDPDGRWPRIVAVVDEFQVLLAGRDALATEAVTLLEDLARRGRSQGIHLVLASQDVSGIEALWGRSSLIAQFTLRIALPKARRILGETNLAAELIPRFHAVVNADAGSAPANRVVRLPDAGNRDAWRDLQERLWRARSDTAAPPRLFDGEAVPVFAGVAESTMDDSVAVVGETIDVEARPAVVRLARAPGRNLAVLGARTEEAHDVLTTAAVSLADRGRFSVACLDDESLEAAKALCAILPGAELYDADTVVDLLAATAEHLDGPHFLIGYAWDAAAARLAAKPSGGGPSGHELLRTVLTRGPERRTHVLGWWRAVARLRDDLGGAGARFDGIGSWLALDVHGADLAPLCPTPGGPLWYPRPRRALFFDRAVHRVPEVVIPYRVAPASECSWLSRAAGHGAAERSEVAP